MTYQVDWSPAALAALAAIWLIAADRNGVTMAQDQIDHRLAADPLGQGKALPDGLYVIQVSPLRVVFESTKLIEVSWL